MNLRGQIVTPPTTEWIQESAQGTTSISINGNAAKLRATVSTGNVWIEYQGGAFAAYDDYIFVKNGMIAWQPYTFPSNVDMIIDEQPSDNWRNSPNLAGFTLPVDDIVVNCEYNYDHAVSTPIVTQVGGGTVTARVFNESDGGGAEVQNTNANIISFAGVNSSGGDAGSSSDFVELYSKNVSTGIGTRVYVSPTDCSIFAQTVAPSYGNTTPTLKVEGTGLTRLTVGSTQHVVQTDGGPGNNLYLPTSTSHTITHRTNRVGFESEQIGTFCESTGELADVYGTDYVPTLDRARDAIVKVRHSTSLNAKVLGIIIDDHTFASHGDVLCRVINTEDWSIVYELGDVLVPDIQGLCRKSTHTE
jgi:hypothetical protein